MPATRQSLSADWDAGNASRDAAGARVELIAFDFTLATEFATKLWRWLAFLTARMCALIPHHSVMYLGTETVESVHHDDYPIGVLPTAYLQLSR